VSRRRAGAAGIGAFATVALALVVGCSATPPTSDEAALPSGSVASSVSTATVGSESPPAGATTDSTSSSSEPSSTSSTSPASADGNGSLPTTIQPVASGELTRFRVVHGGAAMIDARSSGLARYQTSESCEVPGQPCYDAPTFDKVARIDVGASPTVPGTETTFVTGHSNRYRPTDPTTGVFSRLQYVTTGDTIVLTTTKGVFVYAVTRVLTVPFDKLTSTPEVVTVRPNTVVTISCVVSSDRLTYTGNFVVVGTLRASAPV
jgi:hypothetical protein